MVHEMDRLEIPEDIKAMSLEEIQKEKESILNSMPMQKKGEGNERLAKCPITFYL